MVSIAEARRQLQEMMQELNLLNMKYADLRQFELSLNRTASMLAQLTGSRELGYAIAMLHRARMTVLQLIHTLDLLSAAYVAGGPMAWLSAIIAFGVVTLNVTDMAMDLGTR